MAQKNLLSLFPTNTSVSKTNVSIVGTAGRKGDADKMSSELYEKMVGKAEKIITQQWNLELSQIHLVSGGAAWADHVAVTLYLTGKVSALTLHLPAKWRPVDSHNNDPGYEESSAKNNPGKTANKLHRQFSKKLCRSTLAEINFVFKKGAKCCIHDGFKLRNTAVANCEYLLAFTWSEDSTPKKGGTYDTWSKCSGKKVHISLQSLTCTTLSIDTYTCASMHHTDANDTCLDISKHQTVAVEALSQHHTATDVTCLNNSVHPPNMHVNVEETCLSVSGLHAATEETYTYTSIDHSTTKEPCFEHHTAVKPVKEAVNESFKCHEPTLTCPDVCASEHHNATIETADELSKCHMPVVETCPDFFEQLTVAEVNAFSDTFKQNVADNAEETLPVVYKPQLSLEKTGELSDSSSSSCESLEASDPEDANAYCVESQQFPSTVTSEVEDTNTLDVPSHVQPADKLQPTTVDKSNEFSQYTSSSSANSDTLKGYDGALQIDKKRPRDSESEHTDSDVSSKKSMKLSSFINTVQKSPTTSVNKQYRRVQGNQVKSLRPHKKYKNRIRARLDFYKSK